MSPVDKTTQSLTHLLDATAMRHRVLSGNLANAETPGYVRQDVKFEEQLAEAVRTGDFSALVPKVETDVSRPVRADGNNVQLDEEVAELNKNALLHQTAIQILQGRLAMERTVITGRG
jgi:flagellar basal-body rod protein FlgB